MGLKTYIKRLVTFVIKGQPVNNVTVNLQQINYGKILLDKRVIITGGAHGLGYDMAKKCITEGASVLILGRNAEKLESARQELGDNCKSLQFDVTEIEKADWLMKEAEILLGGKANCLICNAGISLHEQNILAVSYENYEKQFQTNLEGSYFLAQSFIKSIENQIEGNLIFISSERGFQCDDVPYGLTKAALNSLTRGLSRRFYTKGIRVNAIAPGITSSDMTKVDAEGNLYCERLASKRYFVGEEIAEVACFLLSDASKCISGEIIACDAGEYLSSYIN